MASKSNIPDAETVWLKAIAADQSERLAQDLIKPNPDAPPFKDDENAVGDKGMGKDDEKVGMEYEPTDAVVVPPDAGKPDGSESPMPEGEKKPEDMETKTEDMDEDEQEPSLSFGEQMLVDRMDDLIAVMSDIRDRLSTTNGGESVSSPQAVVPAEDAGTNLSSALLAALTITDGILATRK